MYMFDCTPTAALKLALDEDAAAADPDALEAPDEAAEAGVLEAETNCEVGPVAEPLAALDAALAVAAEPEDTPLRYGRVSL